MYFCHKCSIELGHLNTASLDYLDFTGSAYLLNKFVKHTIPPTQSGLISIFLDDGYSSYSDYIVNSIASGSVEIDSKSRKNIVWYANKDIGVTFKDGVVQESGSVVKVVLHDNTNKIHAFPIGSQSIATSKCSRCSGDILIERA